METEVKVTRKLIQDQKEEIMSMLHSTSKKIDWSECSDVSDDEDGKDEAKSTDNKIEDELPYFIKIRFGDHRTKPEEALHIAKKLTRERGIVAGTLIEFEPTNTTFTELPSKSQRRKAIKLTEKANDAQHNDLGLARSHIQSQTRELETGLRDTSIWDFLNCSYEYGNLAIGKVEFIINELFEIPINKLENLMVLPDISNQITKALQKEHKHVKIRSDELTHAFKQGMCAKGGEDNPAIQRFQEMCVNTPSMRRAGMKIDKDKLREQDKKNARKHKCEDRWREEDRKYYEHLQRGQRGENDRGAAAEQITVSAQLGEIKKYAKKIKKMESNWKKTQKKPAPLTKSQSSKDDSESESASVASDDESYSSGGIDSDSSEELFSASDSGSDSD
jgi:hypothetical protein